MKTIKFYSGDYTKNKSEEDLILLTDPSFATSPSFSLSDDTDYAIVLNHIKEYNDSIKFNNVVIKWLQNNNINFICKNKSERIFEVSDEDTAFILLKCRHESILNLL